MSVSDNLIVNKIAMYVINKNNNSIIYDKLTINIDISLKIISFYLVISKCCIFSITN